MGPLERVCRGVSQTDVSATGGCVLTQAKLPNGD